MAAHSTSPVIFTVKGRSLSGYKVVRNHYNHKPKLRLVGEPLGQESHNYLQIHNYYHCDNMASNV